MPNIFNRDMFVDVLGSQFTLKASEELSVDLELSEVSNLKETSFQQVFSIILLLPPPYQLEHGLYDLQHQKLGTIQLYLAPVGAAEDGRLQVEAVFNLLREKDAATNG